MVLLLVQVLESFTASETRLISDIAVVVLPETERAQCNCFLAFVKLLRPDLCCLIASGLQGCLRAWPQNAVKP